MSKKISTEEAVRIIGSIKDRYPDLRQKSKSVTFALQFSGTWVTLHKNSGFSPEEAKRIVDTYQKIYHVSVQASKDKLKIASQTGYVTVAFGLRIRTPLIAQSVLGTKSTMHEAEAEGRTTGNAFAQSFGMLNNRAAVAFMKLVWASKYRYDIKPIALIHDAIYLLIRDNVEVVKWVNDNLIECMKWNELPEIQHETVKLGAELDIFYSGWHQKVTIPNGATEAEIIAACKSCATKYKEKV